MYYWIWTFLDTAEITEIIITIPEIHTEAAEQQERTDHMINTTRTRPAGRRTGHATKWREAGHVTKWWRPESKNRQQLQLPIQECLIYKANNFFISILAWFNQTITIILKYTLMMFKKRWMSDIQMISSKNERSH